MASHINPAVRFMIEFKPLLVQIYQCCLSIRTAKTRVQVLFETERCGFGAGAPEGQGRVPRAKDRA